MKEITLFLTASTILSDPKKLEINIDELLDKANKIKESEGKSKDE